MISATFDIVLLNKRLDRATRRDVFYATQISGVSHHEKRQSSKDGGFHSESETHRIRIPMEATVEGGKSYLNEADYDALSDEEIKNHWTIHDEDLVIVCASKITDINTPVADGYLTWEQAEDLAKRIGTKKSLIRVAEYADNTLRGSVTRHWWIGGA